MENQKSEIETIKERTLTIKLSDADCERIAIRAGSYGITVSELLENFIGDLVGGTYSNGSDECMYAKQWFDRCCFGTFSDNSLLRHLLELGTDPKDYLDLLDNINEAKKDKEYLQKHPEEVDEYDQYLDDDIEMWEEELKDMREFWKPDKEVNMEEECAALKKWVDELNSLKGEEEQKFLSNYSLENIMEDDEHDQEI